MRKQAIQLTPIRFLAALWISGSSALVSAQSEPQPTKPQDPSTAPTRPAEPLNEQGDLGRKLIRRTINEGEEDPMAAITRLMDESVRKLQIDFDPGSKTQLVQRQIVEGLDKAIETSAAQRRMRRQSQQTQTSDKRRMARRESDSSKKPRSESTPGGQGDDESTAAPLAGADREAARGEIKDTRRSWGHLPQREREELIQGSEEASIERYREWIKRYYEALQETGK